jgi:hypothetical protein
MRSKKLIIVVVLAVAVIAVLTVLSVRSVPKKNVAATTYTDPWTQEVVSNPAGKGPDTFGTSGNEPVFLGIDKLVNHGLTDEQQANLKKAIINYSAAHNNSVKEVSFDVDHITTQHPDSTFLMFVDVKFNRKDIYQAKIDYSDLTAIQLYLIDQKSQAVIFDSGVVDNSQGE